VTSASEDDYSPGARPLTLAGLVRGGWLLYRARLPTLFALFGVAYAALAALSLRRPSGAGAVGLLLTTILPLSLHAVLGSAATAVAIPVMHRRTGARAAAASLRPALRDIAAAALLAAVLSLAFVLPPLSLLPALMGLSLFALVHGPPIVLHAIVLEEQTLNGAWARARSLLRRRAGRLVLYLLTVALGVRLAEAVLTSIGVGVLAARLTDGGLRPAGVAANLVALALVVPFIPAVLLAAFLDLSAASDGGGHE
jgi:hypothetical protein